MLRRPGQLWLIFSLCVGMILPAMIWLTIKTVRLDRDFQNDRHQTELARREAEIQEKITSALYRMDWQLGPHIAREAARPYYLYRSFYRSQNNWMDKSLTELPSPLLYQTSEFVRLHFQISPGDVFSSPQRPQTFEYCQMALTCCGVTDSVISERDQQLAQVKKITSYEKLEREIGRSGFFEELDNIGLAGGNAYLQPLANQFVVNNELKLSQTERPQQVEDDQRLNEKSKVQRSRGNIRGEQEFLKRTESYTKNTSQWADNNRSLQSQKVKVDEALPANTVSEGVMRPVWIGDELFLARRVKIEDKVIYQCCWLAWDRMQSELKKEVADILPDVSFEKVLDEASLVPERALVTLPVQLVVDTQSLLASTAILGPEGAADSFSGLQLALLVAWIGLILSVVAIGVFLRGVIQLSERRAAFVSAVTHELRTPLTTFKMYSEMLAEEMVPKEKQIRYAETLHREADRLGHLVENVLHFARLERGSQKQRLMTLRVSDAFDGIPERLSERARESGFTVQMDIDSEVLESRIEIEPHILDQVLFNLVDNACKYAIGMGKKIIDIQGKRNGNRLQFSVRDYGPGVRHEDIHRVFQPFHKSDLEAANTEPGVGLGLALCKRMLGSIGGQLSLVRCDQGAKFLVELTAQN